HDVYIIKNGIPELGPLLKEHASPSAKLYFWTGHAEDQPAIQGLLHQNIIDAFDRVICVSHWQKNQFIKKFTMQPEKIYVIRNAISPFFENLFVDLQDFISAKQTTPQWVYTSTPFRGLDILLSQYDNLSTRIPKVHLTIYSSMQVYGISKEQDKFQHLYQIAKNHPKISYAGSMLQIELAAKLRSKHILAYPNTFPETSCIAVMEAMAAGLKIVTSNLAALPETTLGLGCLIEPAELMSMSNNGFSSMVIQETLNINDMMHLKMLYDQVELMNNHHTWRHRALKWENLFHFKESKKEAVA